MRPPLPLIVVVLTLTACSEPGVGPNDPMARAPTVQFTHLGGDPATEDLCGGLSPCDAYDYRGDSTSVGAAGMCFLPPTVDNHVSDPACSAPNRSGLSGVFQLAWCQVWYDTTAVPPGSTPPAIVHPVSGETNCQDPADWQDLVEGSGHYAASVRWRRNGPDAAEVGDVFRVYVVRGEQVFAHRDVIIDPNLTSPADDYVHAIGFGNEPIKVLISEDFSCLKFDTQDGAPLNAATCVIAGETTVSFETEALITTFNFPDGNPTFLADFEVSECLTLGFDINPVTDMREGNALVDVPLADCKISLSSEELETLTVPGQIVISFSDPRWDGTGVPFEQARLNVLQYDEFGIGALPPSAAPSPNWFGNTEVALLRWIGRGIDMLADLLLPEPLAAIIGGAGWDFRRMSDFQVAVMPVMVPDPALPGATCASGEPHCHDLGTFGGAAPVAPVSVYVSAPTSAGPTVYPANHFPVPDTRLHFFPTPGSGPVQCPPALLQGGDGRGCVPAGDLDYSTDPPSEWTDPERVVFVTGVDGIGTVDWPLADGANALHVVACGVARPGSDKAESGDDGVWGDLGNCSAREDMILWGTALDNGPAGGWSPFEAVDTISEVAIYGPPLRFEARTCPSIQIDGVKEETWEICADSTVFTAPLQGPKVSDNARLYTYSDGQSLYVGVEVETTDLGNRIFINLTDSIATVGALTDGVEAAGDELLVIDQFDLDSAGVRGVLSDWHYTLACVGNNAAALCGDPDSALDGPAAADGAAGIDAGAGTVFYEFMRPLGSPNSAPGTGKEDLGAAFGESIGLRLRVTQGQGGGKGGFVYPDPQTSSVRYHVFTIE